jgi:vancomycin resistance protein YoaR
MSQALAEYNIYDVIECTLEKSGDYSKEMDRLYTALSGEGVNATLDKNNNYAIVPSRVGVAYNLDDAKKSFNNIKDGQSFKISATITKPKVTTEDLEKNLFKDVLGSYTTYVSGSDVRRKNVKLAGDKCNEVILLPGEVFSYNGVVGERTKANGFGEAAAYLNGLTISEVGGGVCQPSSTLYNSVMLANLEIVERSPHSYVSSYVPIGRDATVSWGGPDFKFKNNTDYPIKVTSVYKNHNLTMKIVGTNLENITVKITSEQLSSKPYNTIEKKDPNLEVGQTRVEVTGYTGATAQSYRHVYINGKLISSTKEAYSSYKKRDKVVYVGTKPVATPPVPSTPSSPEGSGTTPTPPVGGENAGA